MVWFPPALQSIRGPVAYLIKTDEIPPVRMKRRVTLGTRHRDRLESSHRRARVSGAPQKDVVHLAWFAQYGRPRPAAKHLSGPVAPLYPVTATEGRASQRENRASGAPASASSAARFPASMMASKRLNSSSPTSRKSGVITREARER
jgi:hypothetical protein